jgi:aspartyl-tRNA(Asn)/glutamyl-tRNA(Gln) amidotransferase subunit A
MCGVVGLKPTYGRVSRYGLLAFGSSLDQIGPLTRTVHDAALALTAIAGADPNDATSAPEPVADYAAALTGDIRGARIGVPSRMLETGVDPEIARAFTAAMTALTGRGATLVDVDLPHARYAIPVYYLVATAEASSNLARYDGVRYGFRAPGSAELRTMYARTREIGFGPEVKRRIMLGTYVLSAGYYDAYYRKAQQVRTLIASDFSQVFSSGVDVLFTPTTPTPAFPIGAISDPYEMYMSDIFTATANLAGVPAMSQPIGRVGGLPVGGQLLAAHFEEEKMFTVAYALERALGAGASS